MKLFLCAPVYLLVCRSQSDIRSGERRCSPPYFDFVYQIRRSCCWLGGLLGAGATGESGSCLGDFSRRIVLFPFLLLLSLLYTESWTRYVYFVGYYL